MKQDDKEKLNIEQVSNILGIEFKDYNLIKTALTHRSYLNEYKNKNLKHNERLEFLGDAVLELIVSRHLYSKHPNMAEGELTSFRSAIVRTESLAEEMLKLNIGEYIFMSKGEEQTGGKTRPYILANTFEAITGAIYLDAGLTVTEKFLNKFLFYKIPKIIRNRLDIDSKSHLQEISQEVLKETPQYEIIKAEGPDHSKSFTSKVLLKDKDFGHGIGASKQEAEQKAAKQALKNWKEKISEYFNID